MQHLDLAPRQTTRTMSHRQMVMRWTYGHAVPVSPRITDYALCDDIWWRRGGGGWTSIPDGPFAMMLTAGRERLWSLTGGLDEDARRDPWSVARDRLRAGRCR